MSRLLWGVAAATLAGFVWTSVDDRDATPEPRDDSRIERPLSETESGPSRAATRARTTRNPGGLPARGAGSRGRSASNPVAPAATQPAVSAPVAATGSTPPASSATNRVRRESSASPLPLEIANQPAGVNDAPAPPPEEERPRSSGIAGSVLEKGGKPAAGVSVALKARRVFNGAASSPQHATTDGRGSFAFGAVADGEYEISTEKNERYEPASTLVRAGMDAVVLMVEPSSDGLVSIRGVVESASGGVVADVRIQAIGQPNVAAVTDAKGAYVLRIPAGARAEQTALQFRHAGYRDRRWTMADGQRSNEHEVVGNVKLDPIAAGVSVSGMVSSTNGAPVARARVQLDSAARGRSYRAVTDGGGRFTIANVETGTDYRVWAAQSGFKDGVLENVIVDAGTMAIDVALSPIGVATLRGRMVAPDGAPVPGFNIFLTTASGAGPRSVTVTSDAQGRFLVVDLPEGRVALQTRAAPAISVSGIEVSAARPENDVTVVVDVGAHRFEGRLITSDGEPAAGATVSLESSASIGGVTSRSSRQTMTNADGSFAFTQLGGGVHIVSAALAGAGSVRLEHSIGAGMEPVQITLPGKRGRR